MVFWLPSITGFDIRLSQVFWPALLIGVGLVIISRRGLHNKYSMRSVDREGTIFNLIMLMIFQYLVVE